MIRCLPTQTLQGLRGVLLLPVRTCPRRRCTHQDDVCTAVIFSAMCSESPKTRTSISQYNGEVMRRSRSLGIGRRKDEHSDCVFPMASAASGVAANLQHGHAVPEHSIALRRHRAVPYVELGVFSVKEVVGAQVVLSTSEGRTGTRALRRRREARGPLNAQLHRRLHNHVARHVKCVPTERRHRALLPVAIQVELVDVIGICQGPYIQEPDVLERRKVL